MKKKQHKISGNQSGKPNINNVIHQSLIIKANDLYQKGMMRDAAGLMVKEVLHHPENIEAQDFLNRVDFRRNGMMSFRKFNNQEPPRHPPSITLCLIARNEEKNIAHCLDSFKDFVQEIIVVDTGSTDRTVEIARSYEAEIRYFPWIDDFAAARNVSIQNAKGDWILRMDADEWAEPAEMIKLQNAALSGIADVYMCRTVSINSLDSAKAPTSILNLRLFRNHLGLVFEQAIHEAVTFSAIRLGLNIAVTNIIFLHSGYDVSEQDMDGKITRNLLICNKGLQKNPEDRFLRMLRGTILYRNDPGQGIKEMEAACTDLPQEIFPSRYLEICYIFLIQHYARTHEKSKLSKFIDEALVDYCSDSLMLQFLGEKLLFSLGDIGYAIKVLNRAKGCTPSELVLDLLKPAYYNPTHIKRSLMEAYLLLRDLKTAEKLAGEMKENTLKEGEGSVDHSDELSKENSKVDVLYNLIQETALNGVSEKAWIELAKLELSIGRSALSIVCASHALELNPGNHEAFDLLGIAALQNKDYELAQESFVSALIINPAKKNSRNNLDNFCTSQQKSTAEVLFDQGMKWSTRKLYQKAAYSFMITVRLDPLNSEAQKHLDFCLSKL